MRYQSRMHPTLDILCDSMGRVFVPESGVHKAHWTFGYKRKDGYRYVKIDGNGYLVSRLICETFHGIAPKGKPTCDHIDRTRDRNVPENLMWADYRLQNNNRQMCEDSLAKYGVRSCDDLAAYKRAYRAKTPDFAERDRARSREYLAKQKALGKVRRICPDGKLRYVAKENV